MQIVVQKCEYIKSYWNYTDIVRIIMNIALIAMDFLGSDIHDIYRLAAILTLFLYLKIFYFLRIFFQTAHLIRMISEIIIDMRYFVAILLVSVFAFGNSFYILGRNSDPDDGNFAGNNIRDAFFFSFNMSLGDFDTDGFGTQDEEILWILFLINTLLMLIILLNLVIAIMGDTFDRVQETAENSMLKELATMIRENEFLLNRKKIFSKAKYIIIIEPEKAQGEANDSWEGKLNQLRTFIEASSDKSMLSLKKLNYSIDQIANQALEDKLRPIEDKISNKIISADTRTDNFTKRMTKFIMKVKKREHQYQEMIAKHQK